MDEFLSAVTGVVVICATAIMALSLWFLVF